MGKERRGHGKKVSAQVTVIRTPEVEWLSSVEKWFDCVSWLLDHLAICDFNGVQERVWEPLSSL